MLAGGNETFPPANILSFLPSHYNDYHAFVSSTEHGFFRILGEMSLRGQETILLDIYVYIYRIFPNLNRGFYSFFPS